MLSKSMVNRFLETNSFFGDRKKTEIAEELKALPETVLEQSKLPSLFDDPALSAAFWMQWETDHEMKRVALKDVGHPV